MSACWLPERNPILRFRFLTQASVKVTDLWDAAPGTLLEVYRRSLFPSPERMTVTMEAGSTSDTSINFCWATCSSISEDSNLQKSSCFCLIQEVRDKIPHSYVVRVIILRKCVCIWDNCCACERVCARPSLSKFEPSDRFLRNFLWTLCCLESYAILICFSQ
jgi:hypothetical protein